MIDQWPLHKPPVYGANTEESLTVFFYKDDVHSGIIFSYVHTLECLPNALFMTALKA